MHDLAESPELTPSDHHSRELLGRCRDRLCHQDTGERAPSAPVPRIEQRLHKSHERHESTQRITGKADDRGAIDDRKHHRVTGSNSDSIDAHIGLQFLERPAQEIPMTTRCATGGYHDVGFLHRTVQ